MRPTHFLSVVVLFASLLGSPARAATRQVLEQQAEACASPLATRADPAASLTAAITAHRVDAYLKPQADEVAQREAGLQEVERELVEHGFPESQIQSVLSSLRLAPLIEDSPILWIALAEELEPLLGPARGRQARIADVLGSMPVWSEARTQLFLSRVIERVRQLLGSRELGPEDAAWLKEVAATVGLPLPRYVDALRQWQQDLRLSFGEKVLESDALRGAIWLLLLEAGSEAKAEATSRAIADWVPRSKARWQFWLRGRVSAALTRIEDEGESGARVGAAARGSQGVSPEVARIAHDAQRAEGSQFAELSQISARVHNLGSLNQAEALQIAVAVSRGFAARKFGMPITFESDAGRFKSVLLKRLGEAPSAELKKVLSEL